MPISHPKRAALPFWIACVAAIAVVAVTADHSLAQAAGDVRPPVPEGTPESPTFRTWVLVVLLSLACIGAALIPSKRGHQD